MQLAWLLLAVAVIGLPVALGLIFRRVKMEGHRTVVSVKRKKTRGVQDWAFAGKWPWVGSSVGYFFIDENGSEWRVDPQTYGMVSVPGKVIIRQRGHWWTIDARDTSASEK